MKKFIVEMNFIDEQFGDTVMPVLEKSIKSTLGNVQKIAKGKLEITFKEEK